MTSLFDSVVSFSSTISVQCTAVFRRSIFDFILITPRDIRRISLCTLRTDWIKVRGSEGFKFPAGAEVKSRGGGDEPGPEVFIATTTTTLFGLPVPDCRLWGSGPTLDETFRSAKMWFILLESLAFCSATLKRETRLFQFMDILQGPDGG
ncbi:hypothetical protein CFAM422_012381 [Trichoderma lentiforme]|uniref:Uncharacterized protein n=1 Tax=Trichoderma lentiforme TaxID=1567552 RepID=A0A9P4X2J1_9HYPO|nr:hypothetical protein CFAM422_012381 [Trichoderma lentiforme]